MDEGGGFHGTGINTDGRRMPYAEKRNELLFGGKPRMRFIGNILWFIFGGLVSGMAWVLSGVLWCITVIGIPLGLQCFKFATVSFWPFGRRIEYGGGAVSFLVNVIWFLLNGWWMALGNFLIGCVWCITIIGIPFGKQFFKIAKLALRPFGAYVVPV